MSREFDFEIEHLEKRLALWRELIDLLAQAQAAVLHSDLARVETLTLRQGEVCRQLLEITPSALRFAGSARGEGRADPGTGQGLGNSDSQRAQQRWSMLTAEIARVEKRVWNVNQVYGALLRRGRRTADIYCRALASSAITYTVPAQTTAVTDCSSRQAIHV